MHYIKVFFTVFFALVLVLAGYEWLNKERVNEYIFAAHISEGLSVSTGVKSAITMYYMSTGEFPSSNEEIGLAAPEDFSGQSLTSLSVFEGGVIQLTYNGETGIENGIVNLIPKVTNSTMSLQWTCNSPSYKTITAHISMCEYIP